MELGKMGNRKNTFNWAYAHSSYKQKLLMPSVVFSSNCSKFKFTLSR
jgi:hypothetical protein